MDIHVVIRQLHSFCFGFGSPLVCSWLSSLLLVWFWFYDTQLKLPLLQFLILTHFQQLIFNEINTQMIKIK